MSTESESSQSVSAQRPERPEPAPRKGKPPRIVLNGGPALWVAPGFMIVIVIVGFVGHLRGEAVPTLAIAVFAFSTLATLVAFSWRRADLRLWRQGSIVEGQIIKSFRKTSGSGETNKTRRYVRYRYTIEGTDYERRRETRLLDEPRPIWVLYDPKKPNKSMPFW